MRAARGAPRTHPLPQRADKLAVLGGVLSAYLMPKGVHHVQELEGVDEDHGQGRAAPQLRLLRQHGHVDQGLRGDAKGGDVGYGLWAGSEPQASRASCALQGKGGAKGSYLGGFNPLLNTSSQNGEGSDPHFPPLRSDTYPSEQPRAQLAEELQVEGPDARVQLTAHEKVIDGVSCGGRGRATLKNGSGSGPCGGPRGRPPEGSPCPSSVLTPFPMEGGGRWTSAPEPSDGLAGRQTPWLHRRLPLISLGAHAGLSPEFPPGASADCGAKRAFR